MTYRRLVALAASAALLTSCGSADEAPPSEATPRGQTTAPERPGRDTTDAIPLEDGDVPSAPASHLRVPSAGVDQVISAEGLSDQGTISPDQGQLMWFTGNDRVEPGQPGTAVVAAHVDYAGEPDVFVDLEDASAGGSITVGYADGSELDFTITGAEVIDKATLQTDPRVWGRSSGRAELVLVTCDDALGYRDDGHRTANLVVFAALAPG